MNKSIFSAFLLFLAFFSQSAWAETYSFGVLNHRSALLTAEYWNPILEYVSRKSGVTLELKMGKTSQETSDAEMRGEYDFVFNNHIFAPSHDAAGYRVFARVAGKPLLSQIVVAENSPIRSLNDLQGKEIGFPNKNGFTGYAAPMSMLIQAGIEVKPVFAGNQEGVMAQLRSGAIMAAGVNSKVMRGYGERENFKYRALWTSGEYLDFPAAAHPRIPAQVVKAVRDAMVGMADDSEGMKILAASAAIIKQEAPYGFVPAQDGEYQNQREVYRSIWKKEAR
ncbi:MAG: phosphate/phosphite/phosphonate ABC transporter substrate-binding protein [Sulfuricellaceae bacterium]|nr:phosphate/phosphite/phosphonate ABC transporter substrate-binding protein [Sulfuricellaceae bacterium]